MPPPSMETLPTLTDPKKNMFVEPSNVSNDVIELVRMTPGPKNGHPPLAHALAASPHYGPEFVEKATSGFKRSAGKIEDFVQTFEKQSHDEYKGPSTWSAQDLIFFKLALLYVFGTLFRPVYKSFVIHWCDLFYLPWNWMKSSGWPYCLVTRTRSKGTAWNKFTDFARNVVHGIKHNITDPFTCALPLKHYLIMGYNRFHISAIDAFAKIRLVFGMPMISIACEMQLFAGYLFFLKFYHTSPIAYGREIYNGGMRYIDNSINFGDIIICDDISGFDFHVYFWMIQLVMRIVFFNFLSFTRYWPCLKSNGKYLFDTTDPQVNRRKYFNVLIVTFRWLTQLRVLLPTRELLLRRFQFLPSGAYLTTFLDSVINTIITVHVLLCLGLKTDDMPFIIVLGDDLLFTIRRAALNTARMSANGFYRAFDAKRFELYNMTSRTGARYVGTDKNKIVFLKYNNYFGMPKRNLLELTAGALHRERHLKPEYLASVLVGLAYAAVATCPHYHACLKEAYDFVMRISAEKQLPQVPAINDRYISELKTDLNLSDDDLLTFPSFEAVLDRVSQYTETAGEGTYHNFNHLIFVYPNTSYEYMFEPTPETIDIQDDFINHLVAHPLYMHN